MGIPSYFSFIIKNHPGILRKYNGTTVNRLYLDSNSILYDAIASIDFAQESSFPKTTRVIRWVIQKIQEYVSIVQPTEFTFIAFDGVAPVAKMKQQRDRRYKSWYQNKMYRDITGRSREDAWNTSSFTPGTPFMEELNETMQNYISDKRGLYYSGSDEIGEGEHKIFQHIRDDPIKENIVIYGLDADLIMLSITHLPICDNIRLFRETPHFIQNVDSTLEPNQHYLMDIPELAKAITLDMNNGINGSPDNRIYDYIFICFMLGNDFLPHFPAINIRTGGINKLLNAYKQTIGASNSVITDGTQIFWRPFRLFIAYLSNLEETFLKEETRTRDRRSKMITPTDTPDAKWKNFEMLPTYDRETERYINPYQNYWQTRYYKALFENRQDERFRMNLCDHYLEGLEWCLKYYTTGCPDWRWSYKYNYPPLLHDLNRHVMTTKRTFDATNTAVHPYVQLCYVLPKHSLHLLPPSVCSMLNTRFGHLYSDECDFMWAYCKYFWESHVELPDIDITVLETAVHEVI
jgi:5'-3' exoribonuclease 1